LFFFAGRNGSKAEWKNRGENGHTLGGPTGTGVQLPADVTMRVAQSPTQDGDPRSGLFVRDARQAVSKFLEAGLTLLESLSSPSGADGLGTDAQTRRPTLEIPLPESITADRLAQVITGFLGKYDQTAAIREWGPVWRIALAVRGAGM